MFNLLSFCSAWHGLYIHVYSFHVSGINFPKYWTECCSPSSFLVETLWSLTTMLSKKFPKVWISMTANTFCLCVLWKACITWHFWTTNRKLTFSWKITLQGAIPPLKHLVYMPVGHVVLKIYVPCKNLHLPSQYLYKPCKAYVHCWENKYMPRLKNHLPSPARIHKSLCAPRQDLHAPGMRAHLNVERCIGISSTGTTVHFKMTFHKWWNWEYCADSNTYKLL